MHFLVGLETPSGLHSDSESGQQKPQKGEPRGNWYNKKAYH